MPRSCRSSTSCLRSIERLASLVGWILTCPFSPIEKYPLPPSGDLVQLGGVGGGPALADIVGGTRAQGMIHGNMIPAWMPSFRELLAHLQSSAFQDLAGSRVSARVPVSRSLLNRLVAHALQGTTTPVRQVDIRPRDGDRLDAIVTVSWPFVPPLKVAFAVDGQPQFPAPPVLVLRWSALGGLGAIASRLIAALHRLPPGVRLDGDRLELDIARAGRPIAGGAAAPLRESARVAHRRRPRRHRRRPGSLRSGRGRSVKARKARVKADSGSAVARASRYGRDELSLFRLESRSAPSKRSAASQQIDAQANPMIQPPITSVG